MLAATCLGTPFGWAPWWRQWSDRPQPGLAQLDDILLARWARARAAAGMPKHPCLGHRNATNQEARECAFGGSSNGLVAFLRHFYADGFGPTAILASSGSCLVYRHIWKAAGTSVLAALQRAARIRDSPTGSAPLKFVPTTNATSRALHCPSGRLWFTFVREPISHFVSGYEEYLMRTSAPARWVNASDLVPALLDGKRSLFRQDLVEPHKFGDNDPLSHAYPLAYSVRLFRALVGADPLFIGQMEHLERDWTTVPQCTDSNLASHHALQANTPTAVTRDALPSPRVSDCPFDLSPQRVLLHTVHTALATNPHVQ